MLVCHIRKIMATATLTSDGRVATPPCQVQRIGLYTWPSLLGGAHAAQSIAYRGPEGVDLGWVLGTGDLFAPRWIPFRPLSHLPLLDQSADSGGAS